MIRYIRNELAYRATVKILETQERTWDFTIFGVPFIKPRRLYDPASLVSYRVWEHLEIEEERSEGRGEKKALVWCF